LSLLEKKNLLVIANNYPNDSNSYLGGVFIKEQLRYISNSFNKVIVIVPIWYGLEIVRKNIYHNYKYKNIEVYYVRFFSIPLLYFKWRHVWSKLCLNRIFSFIESNDLNFDIIHAHFTWPSGRLAVDIKERYDVPVIVTEHSVEIFDSYINKKDKFILDVWNKCDVLIRVNKLDLKKIISLGIPKDKVKYVPNGYDLNKFYIMNKKEARTYLGLKETNVILFNLSNLKKRKGHLVLLKAIESLIKTKNNLYAYIGGTGPEKNRLTKYITSNILTENVVLLDFITEGDLIYWYNASDLFVFPTYAESFGIVQLEALACGIPVVATKNVGSLEIINDDVGLLADIGDPVDLKNKISTCLKLEWDREKISDYAKKYDWSIICYELTTIYKHLLG